MSRAPCTRAWQAEAAEDGRLSKADRASFDRHAATCEACRHEVAALAQLRQLGQSLPALTSTPLEHRRLRNEVLRGAHEAGTRPRRKLHVARLAAASLALAAGAAAVILWVPRLREVPAPTPPPVLAAQAEPSYRASASSDAEWSTRQHGRELRLVLSRGRLELSVEALRADQRFIVELPDGELEVKGTRFVVHADGQRTLGVRVSEGRVALRIAGHGAALLGAGEAFEAPSSQPQPQLTVVKTPSARATERIADSSKPARTNLREPAPQQAEPQRPAGSSFARAMTAFNAGDYGRADELLVSFEREQPGDARVEDALFLRAVARSRRGDASGARAIAREYLQRFPNGLRRTDAERLVR